MNVLFYVSGAIAIIAALMVIVSTNAAHAVVYLVLTFLAMASVFLTLGAPLVGVLQIVIYAGAIIILFIFIIMMLDLGRQTRERERSWLSFPIWLLPSILSIVLIIEFAVVLSGHGTPNSGMVILPKEVGKTLYTHYVIGVELVSILLLAALVTGFHFGFSKCSGENHE